MVLPSSLSSSSNRQPQRFLRQVLLRRQSAVAADDRGGGGGVAVVRNGGGGAAAAVGASRLVSAVPPPSSSSSLRPPFTRPFSLQPQHQRRQYYYCSATVAATTRLRTDDSNAMMTTKPCLCNSGSGSLPISSSSQTLQFPSFLQFLQQQRRQLSGGGRRNKGAKEGNHLQALDDLAHETSRNEARERRKKKKERKLATAKGGKDDDDEEAAAAVSATVGDDGETTGDQVALDQQVLPDPESTKSSMDRIVAAFEESLKAIRGAEPTPELFDDVFVSAYGDASTPLPAVAQVVVASPTLATATCYDPNLAKDVCAAIRNRLQLNPSVEEDGVVKIPIPRVSAETRQKTASELNKRTERARQRVRNARRDAMQVAKQGVAGRLEGVSKDDAFAVQQRIEQVTEDAIARINRASEKKHDSIMEV